MDISRFLAVHVGAAKSADTSDWPDKIKLVVDSCHPAQRAFVLDPGRYVAALVGGRGGKTTGMKGRVLHRMLTTKDARVRYFATTRSHAEELMWIPLKAACADLGIEAEWNETKLRMRLPRNGAMLWLVGCDNKKNAEVHRGLPSHEVLIDEAGSFDSRLLSYLIDQVITPRLGDHRGTLVLGGTPPPYQPNHRFIEVTIAGSDLNSRWDDPDRPDDWSGWSLHSWSLADGAEHIPAMANAWELALDTKKLNGWSDDHPTWMREYMGVHAQDDSEAIFKYRSHMDVDGVRVEWNQWDPPRIGPHRIAELPKDKSWQYVYGCDLGHGDDYTEEVFAFSPDDPHRQLLHVYEFTGKEMYPRRIAEHLLGEDLDHKNITGPIRDTGWPTGHVADSEGLGQGYLDELRNVHGIFIKKADKKDKLGKIELFNGDLLDGRIKILKGSKLETQLTSLQWYVDDHGRLRERAGDKNDATDGALYARNEAHHQFGSAPAAQKPSPRTPAGVEMAMRDRDDRADATNGDEYERDWDDGPDDWDR